MTPNPFSQETTPRCSHRIVMEEAPKDIITVDTIPQPLRTPNTSNTSPNTPTTRKRKVDYSNLYNFGFQGPPLIPEACLTG